MKPIAIKPRLSEKAYGLLESLNVYVFEVPEGANKQAVSEAVKGQYKVDVTGVRIAKSAAKTRRIVKRRGRSNYRGKSQGIRKAYVSLKEGDTLPFFAATKEQEAKEAKAEQKARKAEKK